MPAKRIWLATVIAALILVLMGCAVAYVQGWFPGFFSAQSNAPLFGSQLEYIESHKQRIAETMSKNG